MPKSKRITVPVALGRRVYLIRGDAGTPLFAIIDERAAYRCIERNAGRGWTLDFITLYPSD